MILVYLLAELKFNVDLLVESMVLLIGFGNASRYVYGLVFSFISSLELIYIAQPLV